MKFLCFILCIFLCASAPLREISAATTQPSSQPAPTVAIANWDVVPYQTISATTDIGVVAFHESGIAKVTFATSNGAHTFAVVTKPTTNPQSGITEYWTGIDPAALPSGEIELTATAYPVDGTPLPLQLLPLFIQSKSVPLAQPLLVTSSTELQSTVDHAGEAAHIHLAASTQPYQLVTTANQLQSQSWITIDADPGVILTGPGRASVRNLRLKIEGMAIDFDPLSFGGTPASVGEAANGGVWLYHDVLTYHGPLSDNPPPAVTMDSGLSFATNCLAQHIVTAFEGQRLVRNCAIDTLSANALVNCQTMLNISVSNFDGVMALSTSGLHPDSYQMWGTQDDVILDGLTVTNSDAAKVLFIQPGAASDNAEINGTGKNNGALLSNAAFVNITASIDDPDGKGASPYSQVQPNVKHLLFANCKTPSAQYLLRYTPTEGQQVFFQDCLFNPNQPMSGLPAGTILSGCTTQPSPKPNWIPPANFGSAITGLPAFLAKYAPPN